MKGSRKFRWFLVIPLSVVAGLGLALAIAAPQAMAARATSTRFTVTKQQLKINQRIYRAGVRRANRANKRLDRLERLALAPSPGAAVAGPPGPQGAPGTPGPQGASGAAGPGAVRIFFDAPPTVAPDPKLILDLAGFTLTTTCTLGAGGSTDVSLTITSTEATSLLGTATTDNGTDPNNPNPASSTIFQGALAPGPNMAGGASALPGEFSRAIAQVLFVAPTGTLSLNVFELADGINGRCTLFGTAIPVI